MLPHGGRMRGFLILMLSAGSAFAQVCPSPAPLCNDAAAIPNPIYINSGDTQVPVLQRLGLKLALQVDGSGTPTPTTIVYIPAGSCANIANQYTPKFAGGPFFIPANPAFDPTVKTACACQNVSTIKPDMAITIQVPDNVSCPTNADKPPAGITETKGPVQGMTFVVPYDSTTNAGSSQRAITAEEAYLVMGLGAENAQVPPWSDSHFIFGRPATKGTQVSIGADILVPAAKWRLLPANMLDQSSDLASMMAALTADPNAEEALGNPRHRDLRQEPRQAARARLPRLQSAARLLARLQALDLRQAERARRPLRHVVVRAVHRAHAGQGRGAADHRRAHRQADVDHLQRRHGQDRRSHRRRDRQRAGASVRDEGAATGR